MKQKHYASFAKPNSISAIKCLKIRTALLSRTKEGVITDSLTIYPVRAKKIKAPNTATQQLNIVGGTDERVMRNQ